MKKLTLLILFLTIRISLVAQENSKTSTFFFIRHAEKILNIKDPDLTEKGKQRAIEWDYIFQYYKIDQVLSTDYKRTIQTATPIAKSNNLKIKKYHPFKFNVEEFIKNSKEQNIVFVGHSNTIPDLVNSFIQKKKYKQIDDLTYGNLYIVTIKDKNRSDIILNIK